MAKRGLGVPILLTTGLVLQIAEKQPTVRQLYQLAELGKPDGERTKSPEFMQLAVDPAQSIIPGEALDFRGERAA